MRRSARAKGINQLVNRWFQVAGPRTVQKIVDTLQKSQQCFSYESILIFEFKR